MKPPKDVVDFDILCDGTVRGNWYAEHPNSSQCVFQNDFKYSMNLWNKFCLWFYPIFLNKQYCMTKLNIKKNISVHFTVLKDLNAELHYVGRIWITE